MADGFQFDAQSVVRIEAAVQAIEWMAGRGLLPSNLNLGPLPDPAPVECCLAENHPGRGVIFDVYPGTWNHLTHGWNYVPLQAAKAIDWRYGTPYPGAGSKGLFVARPSDRLGTIYECLSLDCAVPPEGCTDTSGSGS